MKKSSLLLSMALMASGAAFAQSTPTHPLDIVDMVTTDGTFSTWFPAWEVGKVPEGVTAIDDEFYKSRTKPLPYISKENDVVDANPDAPYERQFCGFYGATDPTSTWYTLPRYCFEGDTYNMWSYTNMFSNWTAPFFRCTAGLSDVAAKNGASVGVCWTIGYGKSISFNTSYFYNSESRKFGTLVKKDVDGNFMYAEKLVRLMKYYGINALGFNSEFSANEASIKILADFCAECHRIAKELDWNFEVHWYAGTSDSGGIAFDSWIGNFKNILGSSDHVMTDMLFLNYNWQESQINTIDKEVSEWGRSGYDVFAGFDIQGRGVRRTTGTNYGGWSWLKANKISIGFWGAHKQNLIHESSNDYGTADISIQQAYLKKQELIFNGGNNNPAVRPALNENVDGLSIKVLKSFHGLAEVMRAKSTIQQLPFVTRFNIGNGQKFYNRGEVTFDSKWYNLGTQDYLPTWRYWITDASDVASTSNLSSLVNAQLCWDEAWFGGSCLSLTGATNFSRVKLFKTFLPAKGSEEFSLVYKPVGSDDAHLKLFVSLKDAPTSYKEIAVPAGKAGQWNTFTTTLADMGVTSGDIVLMGLVVENTNSEYKTYIGEMALRDPAQTFAPVQPEVKEVEILRGRNNQVDFKMRYAAKEETGETKTYNDEVDTWYYEIFIQQENQEPVLVTATPSWAAYVIGAPLKSGYEGRKARFGVRAVSPNGDTYQNASRAASDIAWSEYEEIPYNEIGTELVVDKQVIKPNETFVLSYNDDMAPAPEKWEIISASTQDVVAKVENAASLKTSLAQAGVYDVRVTENGVQRIMRAKIQVTPEETGAVPEVTSITADVPTQQTTKEVVMTYTARDGEGTVSRAVKVSDPQMLEIPGDIQSGKVYSYALWFKADNFAHLSNGTNLISKNTIKTNWPHNNWGDLWVQIRPEGQGYANSQGDDAGRGGKCGANEISFNTYGWTAHQQAYGYMLTKGYSVEPGCWTHVVVTHDASNNMCIYFDGKLVCKGDCYWSSRRFDTNPIANIYIGGSGVYKAAFNGLVDEVQVWTKTLSPDEVLRCMKGYKEDEVPDGLAGYYTFETMDADGTFPNLGKAGKSKPARIVVVSDAGGENTSDASYVQQEADNDHTGYPGIEGTLEIKTEATWNLTDADIKSRDGNTATIAYLTPGKKDVSLSLTNRWGSHTYVEPELVEITGEAVGIDDVAAAGELEVSAYNGVVAFSFGEAGNYTVNIIGMDGVVLQSEALAAEAGSRAVVAINAGNGVYIVQVLRGGKQVKAVKVIR